VNACNGLVRTRWFAVCKKKRIIFDQRAGTFDQKRCAVSTGAGETLVKITSTALAHMQPAAPLRMSKTCPCPLGQRRQALLLGATLAAARQNVGRHRPRVQLSALRCRQGTVTRNASTTSGCSREMGEEGLRAQESGRGDGTRAEPTGCPRRSSEAVSPIRLGGGEAGTRRGAQGRGRGRGRGARLLRTSRRRGWTCPTRW